MKATIILATVGLAINGICSLTLSDLKLFYLDFINKLYWNQAILFKLNIFNSTILKFWLL